MHDSHTYVRSASYACAVSSRGGTTAANVLSINVVAVWKNRDAYLFTGDAHLTDVTKAAQDFLRIHCMASFKYVDVPHHGSANYLQTSRTMGPGMFQLESSETTQSTMEELSVPYSSPMSQSGRDWLGSSLKDRLLEKAVDELDVFGPLVTNLYDKLYSYSLKTRGQCEVLLYLSGHGIDPGNICLVPSAMKPHPTRSEHDLREIDPEKWYKYDRDRGLAGIPAEHYLISHCGNHHNPSFQTVKDILKRKDCKITLQFLYQERNSKPPVRHGRNQPGISCKQCEVSHITTTQNWHCTCMSEANIRVPLTCHY